MWDLDTLSSLADKGLRILEEGIETVGKGFDKVGVQTQQFSLSLEVTQRQEILSYLAGENVDYIVDTQELDRLLDECVKELSAKCGQNPSSAINYLLTKLTRILNPETSHLRLSYRENSAVKFEDDSFSELRTYAHYYHRYQTELSTAERTLWDQLAHLARRGEVESSIITTIAACDKAKAAFTASQSQEKWPVFVNLLTGILAKADESNIFYHRNIESLIGEIQEILAGVMAYTGDEHEKCRQMVIDAWGSQGGIRVGLARREQSLASLVTKLIRSGHSPEAYFAFDDPVQQVSIQQEQRSLAQDENCKMLLAVITDSRFTRFHSSNLGFVATDVPSSEDYQKVSQYFKRYFRCRSSMLSSPDGRYERACAPADMTYSVESYPDEVTQLFSADTEVLPTSSAAAILSLKIYPPVGTAPQETKAFADALDGSISTIRAEPRDALIADEADTTMDSLLGASNFTHFVQAWEQSDPRWQEAMVTVAQNLTEEALCDAEDGTRLLAEVVARYSQQHNLPVEDVATIKAEMQVGATSNEAMLEVFSQMMSRRVQLVQEAQEQLRAAEERHKQHQASQKYYALIPLMALCAIALVSNEVIEMKAERLLIQFCVTLIFGFSVSATKKVRQITCCQSAKEPAPLTGIAVV